MTLLRLVLVSFLSCNQLVAGVIGVDQATKMAQDFVAQALQNANAMPATPAEAQVQLVAALANDEAAWTLFQNTTYAADESCEFAFGNVAIQLTWGFAGAGDCLLPLPAMNVQIKPFVPGQEKPSTQGLALLLAQKGVIAKIEQQKIVTQLITACSKNPLCLIGLKLALLLKDHRGDKAYVRNEMARLLMRLSLTKLPDAVGNIPSLTALLPQSIYNELKTYAPELLDFTDICWSAMTSNNNNPLDGMYSVEVLVAKNSDSAALIAKTVAGYAGQSFTTDMQDELVNKGFKLLDRKVFDSITKTVAPFNHVFAVEHYSASKIQNLPLAVRSAIAQAPMHTVVTVVTDNAHWFLNKTTTLSAVDTATAFTAVLVNGLRRLVQERQVYFASHPQAVVAHKEAEKKARSEQAQIAKFKASEMGIRFAKGLEAKIEQLKQYAMVWPLDYTEVPQSNQKKNVATLAQLRKQADEFKAANMPVPTELLKAINDLAVSMGTGIPNQHSATPSLDAVGIMAKLAKIYDAGAAILLEQLAKAKSDHEASIVHIADKYEKIVARNAFELKQAAAHAYVNWLNQQAVQLRVTTEQVQTLIDYRYLYACGLLNSTQEEKLAEMSKFELLVGHFLACGSAASLIDALQRTPSSIDAVTHELLAGHGWFQTVQSHVLNQLTLIMKRSPHLKENLDVYRYMIDLYMPKLRAPFDSIVFASQAVL